MVLATDDVNERMEIISSEVAGPYSEELIETIRLMMEDPSLELIMI